MRKTKLINFLRVLKPSLVYSSFHTPLTLLILFLISAMSPILHAKGWAHNVGYMDALWSPNP